VVGRYPELGEPARPLVGSASHSAAAIASQARHTIVARACSDDQDISPLCNEASTSKLYYGNAPRRHGRPARHHGAAADRAAPLDQLVEDSVGSRNPASAEAREDARALAQHAAEIGRASCRE